MSAFAEQHGLIVAGLIMVGLPFACWVMGCIGGHYDDR